MRQIARAFSKDFHGFFPEDGIYICGQVWYDELNTPAFCGNKIFFRNFLPPIDRSKESEAKATMRNPAKWAYAILCVVTILLLVAAGLRGVSEQAFLENAIVGTAYGFWMLYASGVDPLLISTVLYLPGIAVFAIGKRERGEKIFSYSYELFLAVALAVLAILYVVRLLR